MDGKSYLPSRSLNMYAFGNNNRGLHMPATRIVAGRIDIVEPGEAPRPYERFVITLNPDGGRTLRTVTRSPAGDLLRDVNMMVDRDWRPVEGVGRLFLKGELAGTVLRRVFPGRLDSYYWRPGEPMDHAVLEAPANMTLGFHPIIGDAWKTNLMSTDHAEPQEVVVYTVSNTWFGGTLGHGHAAQQRGVRRPGGSRAAGGRGPRALPLDATARKGTAHLADGRGAPSGSDGSGVGRAAGILLSTGGRRGGTRRGMMAAGPSGGGRDRCLTPACAGPGAFDDRESARHRPAVVRRAYLDSRWGQTHVRISGARGLGPPLLLLHPTPKSGWIYETLMGRLGHRCFAIAPDTPGYGASDPPARPASIEDLAVAIMEAVTAWAPEGPVDVMGYHTGSVLAVALSRLYPERVRRLVLTSLPAYDAPTRAAKLEGLSSWPAPEIEGGHLGRLWSIMRARAHPALGVDWLHASFAENLRPGRRGLGATLRSMDTT